MALQINDINAEKVLLYSYIVFKKQMSKAANTDLFNPLVSKARNNECQNQLFRLKAN